MIFVQRLPWRVLAVPTPIFLCITLVPVLPLVYLLEVLKYLWRFVRVYRCTQIVRQFRQRENPQYIVIYSARVSSQKILENQIWPNVPVHAVLWKQGRIADKQFARFVHVLPVDLGNSFPVLIEYRDQALHLHQLHDCVYSGIDQVMSVQDIMSAVTQRIDRLEGKQSDSAQTDSALS